GQPDDAGQPLNGRPDASFQHGYSTLSAILWPADSFPETAKPPSFPTVKKAPVLIRIASQPGRPTLLRPLCCWQRFPDIPDGQSGRVIQSMKHNDENEKNVSSFSPAQS